MARALLLALAVLIARADFALSAPDQPLKMKFEIDCSNDDQVRKTICELSSALLNKDCSSMRGAHVIPVCEPRVNAKGGGDFEEYIQLEYICGADWIPIVARECARRSAGLSIEYQKKLADYLRNRGPYIWAQKEIALDSAMRNFVLCTTNQVENLIGNNETANAIAAAALTLCQRELTKAAQATLAFSDSPCSEELPSPRCIRAEKSLTEGFLPTLAARAMRLRAQAGRGVGRLDGTAPQGGP
jgi:hypothetical protein